MADKNQVTVRFESTVETANDDRLSYIEVRPFKPVEKNSIFDVNENYYIIKNGKYENVDINLFDPLVDYYVKNYIFRENIVYYYLEGDDYIEFDPKNSLVYLDSNKRFFHMLETQLVSGPVDIFATVDVLREEKDSVVIAHPTLREISDTLYFNDDGEFDIDIYVEKTGNNVSLESPYVGRLALDYYESYGKKPVIFVEKVAVFNDPLRENTQTYRGAYFRFEEAYYTEDDELVAFWQEILLGTHSHSNIDFLNRISELALSEPKDDSIFVLKTNGEVELKKLENASGNILPELPQEILDKIGNLERYKELYEPTDSEWHHIDAELSELTNKYDWMEIDEDGNYKNLAVGNCRNLYRSLLKADKKLYLDNNYKLTTTKPNENDMMNYWLSLDVFKVNFDFQKTIEDAINVKLHPTNNAFTLASFELASNLSNKDEVLLLSDGVLVDSQYSILSRNLNKITVAFNRTFESLSGLKTLTVLIVREAGGDELFRMGLHNALKDGTLKLIDINNELASLYIEGEFGRRPYVPKMFLTTDEHGRLEWSNKFIPSQSFYAKDIIVKNDNIKIVEKDERECVRLEFKDVNYKVGEDFPILMVNDFFVFSSTPVVENDGKDLVYYLPLRPISGEGQYDFDLIEPSEYRKVSLIVVKNSVSGLASELAEKYVTKEDAIAILSHGKINLKDFARASDLLKFTKVGHTHSQYSLKDHNHDFRYANYHHTHPEIVAVIAKLSKEDISEEEIQKWVDEIVDENEKQLVNLLESELGLYKKENGRYELEDSNIKLSNELSEAIKNKADELDITYKEDLYLTDAVDLLIKFFEHDTVTTEQVILSERLPVRLINGPVGGISTNKVYSEGTELNEILRDILNPYVSVNEMKRLITPSQEHTEFKWYSGSIDSLKEVDLNEIYYAPNSGDQLYFSVILNNEFGRFCKEEIPSPERDEYEELSAIVSKVFVGGEEVSASKGNIYYYGDIEDFTNKEPYEIKIVWKSNMPNDKVYDGYGITQDSDDYKLNPKDKSISYTPDIKIDYPNIFYGFIESLNYLNKDNISLLNNTSNDIEYELSLKEGFIVICVEKKFDKLSNLLKVIDTDTGTKIGEYFIEPENVGMIEMYTGIEYIPYVYEIMESDDDSDTTTLLFKFKK